VLRVTQDMVLPTTTTGSYPKPNWFNQALASRTFKEAMGDSLYREQYLDAVSTILTEQDTAGLDILTDGDTRFDLQVGGKSWFFYVLERLGGFSGFSDLAKGFMADSDTRPGRILWEVQEAYQAPYLVDKVTSGPLHYEAIWKTAQKLTDKPVKFGAVSAQSLNAMIWNKFYPSDKELIMDLSEIMNEEYKKMVAAGCTLIQVEEPMHHFLALRDDVSDKDLEFFSEAINREVEGLDTEIWVHTCWGNPNQQRASWVPYSYENAIPHLLNLNADVVTFECASSFGADLELIGKHESSRKIGIGVVNHTTTTVEPPELVADIIRKALQYIPAERLILSSDCGFGREGISRRIAFYKCVSTVMGANIVKRELGLPEAPCRAADERFSFTPVPDEEISEDF
jgi:5-methyltetrahydropteroyltriglutamate--homocysteine methyltransferase